MCVRQAGEKARGREGRTEGETERERDLIEYNRNWLIYVMEVEKSSDMLSTRWKSKEVRDAI